MLETIAGFLAGIVVVGIVFYAALDYDLFHRYHVAVDFRASLNKLNPGIRWMFFLAYFNFFEYAASLGVPFCAFLLARFGGAMGSLKRPSWEWGNLLSMAMLLLYLFLGFLTETKGETARLWMFLQPFACILVAQELSRRGIVLGSRAMTLFLFLQGMTVYLTKLFRDYGGW